MPINEPTVANYWGTYTGAIDTALGKGKVILAYWAYTGGKPANTAAFNQMWDTVVAKYGSNPNAYFEVINEPYGYSTTDLDNLYNDWLTRYSTVPRGRVILDGTGDARTSRPSATTTAWTTHCSQCTTTRSSPDYDGRNRVGEPHRQLHRRLRQPHRRHRMGRSDEPGQQERRQLQHDQL